MERLDICRNYNLIAQTLSFLFHRNQNKAGLISSNLHVIFILRQQVNKKHPGFEPGCINQGGGRMFFIVEEA
jgi:hypothetical protein